MKRYQFRTVDEWGNEFESNVSGKTWQDVHKKLCVLINAGHRITVINNLADADELIDTEELEEESLMSILHLVKPGEGSNEISEEDIIETSGTLYKMQFMLMGEKEFSMLATEELAMHIQAWFSDLDEEIPPVLTLVVSGIRVSLDRAFVGAIFQEEYVPSDDSEEEEGSVIDAPDDGEDADAELIPK